MTERVVKVATTGEEMRAAIRAWDAALPEAQPGDWWGDALMRENAERCRAMLAVVGLEDTGKCKADQDALEEKGANEGSSAWIAAHWLAEFHGYRQCRARIDAGDRSDRVLTAMGQAMHEMGRLQSEMFWRPSIDPKTGKAREALSLKGRENTLRLKSLGEMTAAMHGPLREKRFTRMAELIPELGIENAARQCEAEGLGGWQGIKRQWDRFQKKRDT